MLFKSKNNIYNFVYYHEIASIILIEYRFNAKRVYYKIDPIFFNASILPLLRKDNEFRTLLHWAVVNGYAAEVVEDSSLLNSILERALRVSK